MLPTLVISANLSQDSLSFALFKSGSLLPSGAEKKLHTTIDLSKKRVMEKSSKQVG